MVNSVLIPTFGVSAQNSKEAQKCYCESYNCRGYIGANEVDDVEIDLNGSKLPRQAKPAKGKEELPEKATKEEFEDLAVSWKRILIPCAAGQN